MNDMGFLLVKTIVLVLVLVLLVFGLFGYPHKAETELEKCNNDCCVKCVNFNYTFLIHKISSSGIGHDAVDECYCREDNETIKLW